jgi:hypothetical protein
MTKRIAFVLAVFAAFLFVTGSGAFDAASTDRDMSVRVVDDEDAYLGITVQQTEGTLSGDAFALLSLEDNFRQDVSVDSVSIPDEAPIRLDSASMDGPIEVNCTEASDEGGEQVKLTIEVSGRNVEAVKNKQVTVTCIEASSTSVEAESPSSRSNAVSGANE